MPVADTREIESRLGDASLLLVDARSSDRYRGVSEPIDPVAGHVPGAVNVPYQANLDPSGAFRDPASLAAAWRPLLEGRRPQDVVVMCGSGVTACHNLLAMELAGFPGNRLYAGSWSEWITDARRPVERG
jgi:thiosulfate/3-mercaptopyruvate sulfurtransferase